MEAVGHLDQLRRHTDSVAGPAHAPFEQMLDIQPPADCPEIDVLSENGRSVDRERPPMLPIVSRSTDNPVAPRFGRRAPGCSSYRVIGRLI